MATELIDQQQILLVEAQAETFAGVVCRTNEPVKIRNR